MLTSSSASNVIPFPRPAKASSPEPPTLEPRSVERCDPAAVLPLAIDELRDALAAVAHDPQRAMDCTAVAYVWLARLLSRADLPIPFRVDGGPDPLTCWTAAIRDIHTEVERRDMHPAPAAVGNDAPSPPAT